MEKPEGKYKAGVVIGSNKQARLRPNKKHLAFAVIIGVVTVLLVAGWIVVKNRSTTIGPTAEQKRVAAIEDTAGNDLGKAKQQYEQLAQNQGNTKDKATYLKGRGNLCLQYQDYKCVIESYEAADKLVGEDYNSAYNKGYAYEKMGKNSQAIASYEKVKDLIKDVKDEDLDFDRDQIDTDIQRVSQ